jgi:hypothetical protein
LTFSDIDGGTGERLTPDLLTVTADSTGSERYFPELHLCRWLRKCRIETAVHCLRRTGVRPLTQAWRTLVHRLSIEAIVLVDGGTDSLMRGDEAGLGTPVEDASSIVAANDMECRCRLLVVTAFGVDVFHGVCHADVLEAIADLTREGAFLGAFALTRHMSAVRRWRAAVNAVFNAMPEYPSIVSASMLSAVEGRFGDYHMTTRTEGSELFINPLMCLYWVFELDAVARRLLYGHELKKTDTSAEVGAVIRSFRAEYEPLRPWRRLPL